MRASLLLRGSSLLLRFFLFLGGVLLGGAVLVVHIVVYVLSILVLVLLLLVALLLILDEQVLPVDVRVEVLVFLRGSEGGGKLAGVRRCTAG